MKYVTDTKAAQSISAYVIMKGKVKVATVQAHFGNSKVVVNVWDYDTPMQCGSASGYGYDKFTAALSGLIIDGVTLYDHCGRNKQSERILKMYHKGTIDEKEAIKRAGRIGARFANWNSKTGKYDSLHIDGGLERLTSMGYTVIQAI